MDPFFLNMPSIRAIHYHQQYYGYEPINSAETPSCILARNAPFSSESTAEATSTTVSNRVGVRRDCATLGSGLLAQRHNPSDLTDLCTSASSSRRTPLTPHSDLPSPPPFHTTHSLPPRLTPRSLPLLMPPSSPRVRLRKSLWQSLLPLLTPSVLPPPLLSPPHSSPPPTGRRYLKSMLRVPQLVAL